MKLEDVKVGMRVKVYGPSYSLPRSVWSGKQTTVTNIKNEDVPAPIGFLYNGEKHWVHPYQLRKLVKKKRRRVYIREKNLQELFEPGAHVHRRGMVAASTENVWEDGVEFVEVKRKREGEK